MNNIKQIKGVVVLGGHVQGLGIIRIFGEKGIPCYLIDETKMNFAKHSKYCNGFFKVTIDNQFINNLIKLNVNNKFQEFLLIPTNDHYVKLLSTNYDQLSSYYKLSVDKWEVIEMCYNKINTYKIAKRCGVDIPNTYFPKSIDDIPSNIKFPYIIKPAIMHKFYKVTKKKVFLCKNREELLENYIKALKIIPPNEIIIQEVIPGDLNSQYSACFFYNKDHIINSIVALRKRQHPIDFGNATTFAETIFNDELIAKSDKLLSEINYWGLCEVEFKKDSRDGKFKLLEINPRTWKWHTISKKANVNFLLNLYEYIYNNLEVKTNTWYKVYWKHLLLDTIIIIQLLFKLKFNIRFLNLKQIQFAVFDFKDIKPFFFEILYFPIFIFKR